MSLAIGSIVENLYTGFQFVVTGFDDVLGVWSAVHRQGTRTVVLGPNWSLNWEEARA